MRVLRVIVYVGFVINTVLAIRNGFSVMYWVNAVLAALIAGLHIAEIRGRKSHKNGKKQRIYVDSLFFTSYREAPSRESANAEWHRRYAGERRGSAAQWTKADR